MIRYALIGALATSIQYGVLVALVEGLSSSPAPSAVFGAMCGALVAYAGNRQFTFSSRARHRRAIPRFLVIALIGLALNGGIVWAGVSVFAWHYLVAQFAATILVLHITYQFNRSWTFR